MCKTQVDFFGLLCTYGAVFAEDEVGIILVIGDLYHRWEMVVGYMKLCVDTFFTACGEGCEFVSGT